ncbi:MAG: aspartate-semialdehyde dehydrogenase, partial [Gemmatimonadaceae bacterium]
MAIPGKRKTKWPVAVLGATGAVGQMFVRLLANHPWFEIAELAASERSAGKKYGEVTRWLDGDPAPLSIQNRRIIACDPGVVSAPIVFSA